MTDSRNVFNADEVKERWRQDKRDNSPIISSLPSLSLDSLTVSLDDISLMADWGLSR
jgi:hypothetical protein